MPFILHNIISNLLFLLAAVLVFMVHELGHYLAARLGGVHVDSVTIGFGREIWARQGSDGARWSVRILPVCGFVRFEPVAGEPPAGHGGFRQQPVWKRLVIVAAGPAANFLWALAALLLFFTFAGAPSTPPVVTGVEIGSPAALAGFQPGDIIAVFRGQPLERYEDMQRAVEADNGIALPVTLRRQGQSIDTAVTPVWVAYNDTEGFAQAHGRTGLLMQHIPMMLSAIVSVGSATTNGDAPRTRALLRTAMDRTVTLGIKAVDRRVHIYTVHLSAQNNPDLKDPASPGYGRVYLDDLRGNVYLPLSTGGSLREAGHAMARLMHGLMLVTGRLGAWDKSLIAPETPVARDDAPVKFAAYNFVHVMATLSLCIGLLNLLPLPGVDGGFLLGLLLEAAAGPARAKKLRRPVLRLAVACLVTAWVAANSGFLLRLF